MGKCYHSFERQDRIFGLHKDKTTRETEGLIVALRFYCKTENNIKVIKALTFSAFICDPVMG